MRKSLANGGFVRGVAEFETLDERVNFFYFRHFFNYHQKTRSPQISAEKPLKQLSPKKGPFFWWYIYMIRIFAFKVNKFLKNSDFLPSILTSKMGQKLSPKKGWFFRVIVPAKIPKFRWFGAVWYGLLYHLREWNRMRFFSKMGEVVAFAYLMRRGLLLRNASLHPKKGIGDGRGSNQNHRGFIEEIKWELN